jgi:chromosome segregation ATPase
MAIQSGRDTLASIDHALAEVDRHMGEVDAQIRATSEKIVTLRQQETRLYETLAKLRIDLMATGKLAAELDSAHRQASSLLDDREQALTDLRQRIGRSEATRTALQERRARSAAAVDAADERLDAAQASAQTHLSADSAYQQQLALAQEADRVAELAEEKTRVAEMDRSEKGRPYEQDPLFHYLWERDYGTAQYQGSRLIRRLDDWVARLCGYQTARPNYAMLLEIPRRLREHAQGRRSRADAELQALQQLERGAAGDKGVPAAEQALADARGRLNELDQEIETAEAALAQVRL